MQEELVLYGKNNPEIYPELSLWGFPISLYLFLGGMAAGILIITTSAFLIKKHHSLPDAYHKASGIAVAALILGTFALLFDLHKILNTWRLFTHFDLQAPMSWGAWTLLAVIPLSILWAVPYRAHLLRKLKWKEYLESKIERFRKPLAFLILLLSIILGVYTGMLLSAMNARPLWDSPLLPVIFLVSGISTGVAVILIFDKNPAEKDIFRRLDIWLIVIELALIVFYAGDLFRGSGAQVLAISELAGGHFAFLFWVMVILVGLVIPAILEWRELKGEKIPALTVPVLILLGGLAFRIIIVEAGQLLG